jgi:phosphatidylinositol 4-phosphatase
MLDAELIFEKEITIYNLQNSYIIEKRGEYYSLSKENRPKLEKIDKSEKSDKNMFSSSSKSLPITLNELNLKKQISTKCYGVIGVLSGVGTDYLMVISKALLVSLFFKSKICQIKEIAFLPYDISLIEQENKVSGENNNINSFDSSNLYSNKENIQMIKDFLQHNTLYFSDAYNLTSSILENFNRPLLPNHRFIDQLKSQFCWNYDFISKIQYIYDPFNYKENFIFPIINGFISNRLISEYDKEFNYLLIARKDNRRSGVRFLTRGSDNQGNISNLVESEQIVIFLEDDKYNLISYIQVRGSIPIIWSQPSDFQFVPKIHIDSDFNKQMSIFSKHISELTSNYGKLTLINLIDKKGDQKKIGEFYENLSNASKGDSLEHHFIWFDFHAECKKMKYENLNKLLKKNVVVNALNDYDYTHIQLPSTFSCLENQEETGESEVNVIAQQNGIFRTNCIDSLDRTNVVQTLLARNNLHKILYNLNLSKVQPSGDAFEPFNKHLEKVFRNFWADHGDHISKPYSGTPAQKGDFTRLGKRTKLGAVNDLCISGKRYYLGNLRDGYRQDCHDYFLGRITPFKFIKRKNLKYTRIFAFSLPVISYLVFLIIKFSIPGNNVVNQGISISNSNSYLSLVINFLNFCISFYITAKFLFSSMRDKMYDRPSKS